MVKRFLHQPNIVYTHNILIDNQDKCRFDSNYTVEKFDEDVRTLKSLFEFVPLSDIVKNNIITENNSHPLLALTFDDGLDLIRNGIMDVLDFHRVKATTFVITSCIDNMDLMWRHKLIEIKSRIPEKVLLEKYNKLAETYNFRKVYSNKQMLNESKMWPMKIKEEVANDLWNLCNMPPLNEYLDENKPYFSGKDLDAWINRGYSIGLHTHSHPFCSRLDVQQIEDEIIGPSNYLRKRFNLVDIPFAYPFGDRLPRDIELELYRRGVYSCALGVDSFSNENANNGSYFFERSSMEPSLNCYVFGKNLIHLLRSCVTT
jgi:peptidoglycan/xylan/chitin deacetylase (PgdA/CDA1 family)